MKLLAGVKCPNAYHFELVDTNRCNFTLKQSALIWILEIYNGKIVTASAV